MGSLCPHPLPILPPRAPAPLTFSPLPHWQVGPPCAGCGFCGWGGGRCVSSSPSPQPLHPLTPGLSPLRHPRRLTLPVPQDPKKWASCDGRAGVWPLCGPPPGVSRTNRATMAQACSSGVPLPPNGGGDPPPSPVPSCTHAPLPSPPLCPALGGFHFPPPPSPPLLFATTAPPSSSPPSPGPLGLGLLRWKSWGLATMWAAPPEFQDLTGPHSGQTA